MDPNVEIISQAIARLRRAQPINPDTMLVCEQLEKRIIAGNRDCQECVKRRADAVSRVTKHRQRKIARKLK